jgi:hypothetical protein
MATINEVNVTYKGRHSVGAFLTIVSQGGAGWEPVTDPGDLLAGLPAGSVLDHVRVFVPVGTQEEGLVAGINIAAEHDMAGSWNQVNKPDGTVVPTFQMLAGDTNFHIFFVEYGRRYSRVR